MSANSKPSPSSLTVRKTLAFFCVSAASVVGMQCLLMVFTAGTAYAADVMIYPDIASNGAISMDTCPFSGNITAVTAYTGLYPSTTTVNNSYTGSFSCVLLTGGSYKTWDGWGDNAIQNVTGYYWYKITTSLGETYTFTAYNNAGDWNGDTNPNPALCLTCTRFITHNPEAGENVATSTFTPIIEHYYVSEDDYWEGHTYIKYTYKNFTYDDLTESYESLILNSGYSTSTFIAHNITESGTYSVVVEIYQDSWFTFRDSKILSNFNFYSNSTSTIEDMIGSTKDILSDIYGGITCSVSLTSFGSEAFDCMLNYIWATVIPPKDTLSTMVTENMSHILSLPPFGYASRFSDILQATSTGSSTAIGFVVSFPEDSPMRGSTLNLNASQGLHDAIEQINTENIETIEGGAFDKFLTYWNALWWIMFVFWVVREIYGMRQSFSTPTLGNKGALSDNSSTDDSYRLKEWLYSHKN